jgi:hypothetical protein
VLLAVDPWQVAFSRAADGAIFSAFFALAIISFAESTECGRKTAGSRGILAVLCAAFAASGIEFWSFAPPVAAFLLCSGGRTQRLRCDWNGQIRQNGLKRCVGIFAFSFFLLASLFGWRWENLARVGSSLTDWLRGWDTGTAAYSWDWVLAHWLREQPLTLAAGLAGLVMLWLGEGGRGRSRSRGRAVALGAWAVWGLLLTVQAGRGPSGLLVAGLPLELAAAFALGRLMQRAALNWDLRAWLLGTGSALGLAAAVLLWTRGFQRLEILPDLRIGIEHAFVVAAALGLVFLRWLRLRPVLALLVPAWLFAAELNGSRDLLRRMEEEPVFFNPIGHPDLHRLQHEARLWVSGYLETGRDVGILWESARHLDAQVAWHLREIAASGSIHAHQEVGGKANRITGRMREEDAPIACSSPIRYRAGVLRTPPPGGLNPDGRPARIQIQSEVVSIWLTRR